MELYELDILINGLGIEPSDDDLNELYSVFNEDFEKGDFYMNGLKVKIIQTPSKVIGYESYPETFVHLITRKGNKGERLFDRHRANKIHWVKCILNNRNDDEISYFEYPEVDGTMRHYYWFKEGDFLVIMEPISPNYAIITSFHIDNRRNRDYFEKKEQWYKNRQ